MEKFMLKLRIFAEFIIVFGLGYVTVHFNITPYLTLVLGFFCVFIFFQALGLIDRLNGYGPYNNNNQNEHHHPHHHNDDDEQEIENDTPYEDDEQNFSDEDDNNFFLNDDDDELDA